MYEAASTSSREQVPGLEDYLNAVRNRKWLPILGVILGFGLATLFVNSRTDVYQAGAKVVVNPTPVGSTNSNLVAPNLEREREVAVSNEVALGVIDELGLEGGPGALLADLKVQFTPQSDVLSFSYQSTDPTAARDRVNAFAEGYAGQREADADAFYQSKVDEAQLDLDSTNEILAEIEAALTPLNSQLQAERAKSPDARSQELIDQLVAQASLLNIERQEVLRNRQAATRDLSTATSQLRNHENTSEVLQTATVPNAPIGLGSKPIQAAGVVLGLIGGVIVAFIADRLDKTARESDDVEAILGSPVLARVPRTGLFKAKDLAMLSEKTTPRLMRTREAYRQLRASIEFISANDGPNSFLFTSARPGEGKSSTAANVALALAQAGVNTVLISADLRRPSLEERFGIKAERGLAQWLAGDEVKQLEIKVTNNLIFIPSGSVPENPGELLASGNFSAFIAHYEEIADIVIIDTPPVLSTADAATAASRVGGAVLVIDGRRTRTDALADVVSTLTRAGGTIAGAVINRASTGGSYSRYDYYAYEKQASKKRKADAS